jgi:hypothetical protein
MRVLDARIEPGYRTWIGTVIVGGGLGGGGEPGGGGGAGGGAGGPNLSANSPAAAGVYSKS